MKILPYAHNLAPMVGGAETFTMLLGCGLAERPELAGGALELTVVAEERGAISEAHRPFPS